MKIRALCDLKFLETKVDALKVHSFELYLEPIKSKKGNEVLFWDEIPAFAEMYKKRQATYITPLRPFTFASFPIWRIQQELVV